MMPFSLIDAASPSRSLNCRRGWLRFGEIRSTSSMTSPSRCSMGASGIRELRPLPSALRFPLMADDFPREIQVRLRPFAANVVEHDRFAEARRFPQADVTRHDGLEH